MKNNIKTLKPYKNHKNEWIFPEGSFEGDKFALFLKDGDLTPLFYMQDKFLLVKDPIPTLYIPWLSSDQNAVVTIQELFCISEGKEWSVKIATLDNNALQELKNIEHPTSMVNIISNWSHYIDKDSTVLFLSDEDYNRYMECIDFSKHAPELNNLFINLYPNVDGILEDITGCKNISIILPELHANGDPSQKELYPNLYCHIQNINNIAKELKEKYGVERVELFVSHCFEPLFCKPIPCANNEIFYRTLSFSLNFDIIDKITTTNSTGVLEVQDSERLKVVDCLEFFG